MFKKTLSCFRESITPQSLEKQIDKLQQEMSALVKIIAQGGDSEFYAAKLRQLSEQKMGLTSQLQEIQKKKMADRAQEYQYQQALLYINNEENLNLTEFNDDFSTNPTRFQHPVAGTYKKECIEQGKKYFSVASGGGTGRTLHPD